IAMHHWILSAFAAIGRRNSRVLYFRLSGFPQLLSIRRETRNGFEVEWDSVVSPDAGKITRVESMAFNFVFFLCGLDVGVVLAARTGFPARSGCHFRNFEPRLFPDREFWRLLCKPGCRGTGQQHSQAGSCE